MSIELFRIIGGEERDQIGIFSAVATANGAKLSFHLEIFIYLINQ
jgi:hypothetical protein